MKQSATAIPLSWTNIEMSIEQFSSHLSDASFSKIDTDPVGQRPDIESMSKREGIINVIFRGYDFGELKLRTLTEPIRQATAFKYRSIDGGHRKRAIRDFIANKFKTGSYTATYINGEEINIGNKYYKDLPENIRRKFLDYKMRFTIYGEEMTNEQAGEQFRTTNICTDVNHQEMLNSYEDNLVAEFVRETCRPIRDLNNKYHNLFEYKSLNPEDRKQFYWQKASTRLRDETFVSRLLVMLLKTKQNSTSWLSCSETEIENFFVEYGDAKKGKWVLNPGLAKQQKSALNDVLNFILEFSKSKKTNSKILMSTQDFTLISRFYMYLIKTYGRNGFKVTSFDVLYNSIRNSMDKFLSKDPVRLETHKDDKGVRLVCECFKQYLTVHDDIKRSEQSIKWLLEEMNINDCGIIQLDPVRVFSPEMIEEVLRKQNGLDYVDGLPLSIRDAVGAHIVAHSEGGRTEIDNCAAVRKDHNTRMGSMNVDDYKRSLQDHFSQPMKFQTISSL